MGEQGGVCEGGRCASLTREQVFELVDSSLAGLTAHEAERRL